MRCSRNFITVAVCFLIGTTSFASKKDDKLREEALKDPKKESKKKGKDRGKGNEKSDPGQDANSDRMSVPMVPGHDSLGLKIPVRSKEDGKLQMMYTIKVANLPDKDHMKMVEAQVETFGEDGGHEMFIELPNSIIDLNTRIITTQQSVTIRHDEFELTGHAMEFNTVTKQGKLSNGVRMVIYNLENEEAAKPDKKANDDE